MLILVSPINKVQIVRKIAYPFINLWKEYGVDYKSLTIGAQQYFIAEILRRCTLYIPKDIEESTADEDIEIEIKPLVEVNYYRGLVGSNYKFPITLTSVGFKSELIGIKAVVYDLAKIKENGMFFIVNPNEWAFSEEERKLVPKKKDYQKDELADFSWLPEKIKKKGYAILLSNIKVEENPIDGPTIVYKDKYGLTNVDYLTNIFQNIKKNK